MLRNLNNNEKGRFGFTLVELLVVIALMALMGLVLAANYFSTIKKVRFTRSYESVIQLMRNSRSLAISNAVESDQFGEQRIGIVLDGSDGIAIEAFVDSGTISYELDDDDLLLGDNYFSYSQNPLLGDFRLEYDDYMLELLHPAAVDWPIYVYYEGNSGEVSFFGSDNVQLIDAMAKQENVLAFRFSNSDQEFNKDIMLLRASGIAEPIGDIYNN
ncbi:hypothetical protein CVV38_02040 [Candidatus Peregrinibacteria bacterium HGW-Peregrinibacteria-1]|jgi:prepilin-type N-terminal cleavage/methylation domain-containing protein|nr:MAG: hypothetical protein CVV38_02040 [Candidatus Peregrinibacteria bacterium HGW-Peregrinibacteria-1]